MSYIDLLIKIKNAQMAQKKIVKARQTKINEAVSKILQEAGFLTKVEIKGKPPGQFLEIKLNPERPINGIRFLSRPSVRRYSGYKDFKIIKGGRGLLVVSTSRGIMTGQEARKIKIGGQLLFEIW